MTVRVPPSSLPFLSTVFLSTVIVSIIGAKLGFVVGFKRVIDIPLSIRYDDVKCSEIKKIRGDASSHASHMEASYSLLFSVVLDFYA